MPQYQRHQVRAAIQRLQVHRMPYGLEREQIGCDDERAIARPLHAP
jgi:hypothetical protein